MKIVPKGQDGAPLCPARTWAFSAEDVPPGAQVTWSVLNSTCHALTVDNIGQPRTQGPDALLLAMPHDLAKGGTLTLRATATGAGSPVQADANVAVHGFPVTWQVTFNELAVITPEKRPAQLRVGGHHQAQQDWFSAKANVILQVTCKRPTCSWRDLRVGWAQSLLRNYRQIRWERGAREVRQPGQDTTKDQGDQDNLAQPVRDTLDQHQFFVDDARTVTFRSPSDSREVQLRDFPGTAGDWVDSSQAARGNLRTVTIDVGFVTWLVLKHEVWVNRDVGQAVSCLCNFRWGLRFEVRVANVATQALQGEPFINAPITHGQVQAGKGPFTPEFAGPGANDLATFHDVP
jgi:hypothetical protein